MPEGTPSNWDAKPFPVAAFAMPNTAAVLAEPMFVVVLENPFFVQPADDGTFKIENVPPGTYTIKAWHERVTSPEQKITVTAGTTTTAIFVLE